MVMGNCSCGQKHVFSTLSHGNLNGNRLNATVSQSERHHAVLKSRPNACALMNEECHFKIECPMILIPIDSFEKFHAIPRSNNRDEVDAIDLDNISSEERKNILIIFVSHRWLRASLNPAEAHPDLPNGIKHELIVKAVRRLQFGLLDDPKIYIWIDFCSIHQDDLETLKKGVASLPGYVERSDILLTPYTDKGMEDMCGSIFSCCKKDTSIEQFLELAKTEYSLIIFSKHRSLAEYQTRGWCRLEAFMGAYTPMPRGGYEYFSKVGVSFRKDRPHLFFLEIINSI
mmetsp:Transcript_33054/g.43510  ORF Transcript_33054/g.43510 Transcript_33054/m.43510 type:complete len:286 (+) Transcript_33054:48-905(+)